jgi:hypothetical protein
MYPKIKTLFVSLFIVAGIMGVATMVAPSHEIYAQGSDSAGAGLGSIKSAFPDNTTQNADVPGLAKRIIDWALYLAAIISVLFIIYGGFLYITSAGDATQAGKGKSTLINAIIGLVIVILSYMIVQTVYSFIVS